MITKRFGEDFNSDGGALTLRASEVCEVGNDVTGKLTRTHSDGWTISGEVQEDYYYWVNDFEASHPTLGKVCGNFEGEVHADSEEAFKDFWTRHEPEAWDYQDI